MALFTRETGKAERAKCAERSGRVAGWNVFLTLQVMVLAVLLMAGIGPAGAQLSSPYSSSGYGSSISSYSYGTHRHHRGNTKLAKKKKMILARARLAAFGAGGVGSLPGSADGLGSGQGSLKGMMGSHSTASLMMRAAMTGHGGGGVSAEQVRMGMMKMRLRALTGGHGLTGTPYGANSIIQMRRPRLAGISTAQLHHIAEFSIGNSGSGAHESGGAKSGSSGGGGNGGTHTAEGNPLPRVDTYILGPGDVLRITVEGHQDYDQDSVTVPPDGYLRLPYFKGAILATGKTVPQVRELLTRALADRIRDPKVAVTPEAFRTTTLGQVFVVGAVKTPGPVDIKAGYRVTEVLAAVGGVDGRPEEMHALLTRPKSPSRTLDLHALLSFPNSTANLHVQVGDFVTITPIDPGHIAVLGAVARPGVYDLREKPQAGLFEVSENPHLRDAIVAAGGLMATSSVSSQGSGDNKTAEAAPTVYKATLVRKNLTSQLHLMEALDEKDHEANIALENGDFINIEVVPPAPPVPPITVYVDGQVKNPGSYQMVPGAGVLQAVAQAGGMVEGDEKIVATVRRAGTVLPVDLHNALYQENGAANLVLQDKDLLRLDEKPGMRVIVMGQVGKPADLRLNPNARIIDALAETGGLSIPPESARITIVRQKPNGTQARLLIDAVALEAGDLAQNAALQPGDVVNVSQVRTKSIFISGEVKRPGLYLQKGPITLPELIAQAGGSTDKAMLTQVQVQREGQTTAVDVYGALKEGQPSNFEVQDGDLVVVPPLPLNLTLVDGVVKPGRYALPEKGVYTIADAIQSAGGPRNTARLDKVALLRDTGARTDKGEVYTEQIINLNDRTNPARSANLPLQPGDIVYVPQERPSQNRLGIFTQALAGAIDLKVLSGY